jgi:sulfite reductase alpha subunit-like flavoprotein
MIGSGHVSMTNGSGTREAQKHMDPTDPDPQHCLRLYRYLLSTADLSFCVFGLGNSVYEENFNTVAKDVDRNLHRLSANRLDSKPVLGDL